MRTRRSKVAVGLVLLSLLLGACGQERMNDSEIGVHYTHGMFEGDHFEKVIEPGGSQFVVDDEVYKLPARQITWQTSESGDAAPLVFKAKGGEQMVMELTTRFFLNTTLDDKDEPFKTFFNDICRKYDCWQGALSGTSKDDGWFRMLDDIVGDSQRSAAIRVGREFEADALRYESATADEFADLFADEFTRLLDEEVGVGNIFCGPGYERGSEECGDVAVNVTSVIFANADRESIRERQRLAEEQESLAVQEAETAAAQQKVNEAKATPEYEALQRAQAMVKCAENPECTLIFSTGGTPLAVPAR